MKKIKHSDYAADDLVNVFEDIQHHGVKGQKWGVRKKSRISTNDHVTLSELPDNLVVKARKKLSKKFREEANKNHVYKLTNSEGKKIGDLDLYDESKKSMNVVWVSVDGKHQGHGYATDTMRQVIDLAKKKKMSQVTLEVPGQSPDAHHIYKKLGFKDGKKISSDDDFWGGLTSMKKELKHMDQILAQDIGGTSIEHHGVKGMKWGVRRKELSDAYAKRKRQNQLDAHFKEDSTHRVAQWERAYDRRSQMSDSQLNSMVKRLRLENEMQRLVSETSARQSQMDAGRGFVSRVGSIQLSNSQRKAAKSVAKLVTNAALTAYDRRRM